MQSPVYVPYLRVTDCPIGETEAALTRIEA